MPYGIKVSRLGYDVNVASDKQLAFSSEWPLLPIEAEGTFDITLGETYDEDLYTHNLGYPPVFMFWLDDGTNRYPLGPIYSSTLYVDSTILHIADNPALATGTIHWKIFRRSLLTDYDSGTLISTDASEKDSGDYGIKVSLPGEDVNSEDKRDTGIRSDVRQLMIHKTGGVAASLGGDITHDLGYRPMYWLFVENTNFFPSGSYSIIQESDDFTVEATTTELKWVLSTPPGLKWAYLIFKDPVNAIG